MHRQLAAPWVFAGHPGHSLRPGFGQVPALCAQFSGLGPRQWAGVDSGCCLCALDCVPLSTRRRAASSPHSGQHVTLSSCRALTPHLGCSDTGVWLAHTFTFPLLTVPPREHLGQSPGLHYREHDRLRPPSTSCAGDWMGTVMVKSIPTTLYPPRPLSRTRGQTCICLLTLSWRSSFALGSQRSLCSRGLPTPGLTRN